MKNLPKWQFNIQPFIDKEKLAKLTEKIKQKTQPIVDRWVKFTPQEKQLVSILAMAIGIFIMFSLIGTAIDITNKIHDRYTILEAYTLDTQSAQQEFKDLSKITANEFSTISLSRIQGDVMQALGTKDPDVTLQDNLLIITSDNVLFDKVIPLLDQLRKSYGIFPNKLKMTQSKSGYVNFSATFLVSQ